MIAAKDTRKLKAPAMMPRAFLCWDPHDRTNTFDAVGHLHGQIEIIMIHSGAASNTVKPQRLPPSEGLRGDLIDPLPRLLEDSHPVARWVRSGLLNLPRYSNREDDQRRRYQEEKPASDSDTCILRKPSCYEETWRVVQESARHVEDGLAYP